MQGEDATGVVRILSEVSSRSQGGSIPGASPAVVTVWACRPTTKSPAGRDWGGDASVAGGCGLRRLCQTACPVELFVGVKGMLLGVSAADFETSLTESRGQLGILQNLLDGRCERTRLTRWNEVAIRAAFNQFWQSGRIGGDNGQSCSCCLQGRDALDFHIGCDGENVALAIKAGQILLRHKTQEMDMVLYVQTLGEVHQLLPRISPSDE